MAATGAKVAAVFAFLCVPAFADRAADVLAQLAYAANALSNNNPSDAMEPFDKSCPNYDQIKDFFNGLTNSYAIRNEIDVADEDDSAESETKITINWTITLTPRSGQSQANGRDDYNAQVNREDATERRVGDVQVRLVLKRGKWKIVSFSPIAIFDPQIKQK